MNAGPLFPGDRPDVPAAGTSPRRRWTKRETAAVVAIAATAVVAVAVALIVFSATRPTDAEMRRQVARDFGVPAQVFDNPLVERLTQQASDRAKTSVFDQLDRSIVVGGAAGLVTAVAAAFVIVGLWRPFDQAGGETPDPDRAPPDT